MMTPATIGSLTKEIKMTTCAAETATASKVKKFKIKVEKAKILLTELKDYFGEDDNIIIEAKTILSFLE